MTQTLSPTDILAVSALSAEFGYLVDHGRAMECAALFIPDARMIFGAGSPKPGTLEGIDAIRAFLANRQAQTHVTTRHIATNFRLISNGPDEIVAESLLQVYRSEDQTRLTTITVVAEVEEVFCRTAEDGWLIRQRTTTPL